MAKKFKETPSDNSAIVRRLDAIIAVLLETPYPADGKPFKMMKRIDILNSAGLRNFEIAQIIGLKPSTIAVVLNSLRKKEKMKEKK